MSKYKKNKLDGLFIGIENITDDKGHLANTVLYNRAGYYSSIFEIENGVQQYCTDADSYYAFMNLLANILETLGENYALQKQDIFIRQSYHHDTEDDAEYLTKCYFRYFEGRVYTSVRTFLIITQNRSKSKYSIQYEKSKWADFKTKVKKVENILEERGIPFHRLSKGEIDEYLHRFMAFDFRPGAFGMTNFMSTDECLKMGDRTVKCFPLVDIDVIDLPTYILPVQNRQANGYDICTDLLSFLFNMPLCDTMIYNQVIQVPAQRREQRRLIAKSKRHAAMPDPSNKVALADITDVLNTIATQQKKLVWCNFNIIVSCQNKDFTKVTSQIETKLFEIGITPSKSAYNQFELFTDSFPGNAYSFNKDYDLFLCLSETALCLFFKEHLKHSEDSPLKVYYTDRQGIPLAMDFTGKEGKVKYTDNSNFFCLGPSGSGKSFHMNSVIRQLLEQDTDVVMVDTGNSYEGICGYYHGAYISYTEEHPISMNPFRITDVEYHEDFEEKINFLKSLIFNIFKGNEPATKLEDTTMTQVLNEYYSAYFHPFTKYTEEERAQTRQRVLLSDKQNGRYEKYLNSIEGSSDGWQDEHIQRQLKNEEEKEKSMAFTMEEREHHAKIKRQVEKLHNLVNDKAATEGEKIAANRQLMRLTPQLIENSYLMVIDEKVDHIEKQRQMMKVTELSFNSFYEYALERIPQITDLEGISFDINPFAAILGPFYKGGTMSMTLNNDMDQNLFDEKFIVFEIDKITDNYLLFSIVVLIIMDVFLQKMRIKKGRKALIIEEAWKAISTPIMAGYIRYLYKTVRKFHGIAGVVTQELNDVIDSPIVKEAIINNSEIKILLDQSKFKDRYGEISSILGLNDIQKRQIFTVNALDNHQGRNFFKEVWIARGKDSDVYGIEEPPECYMAFTTERAEKEALKIYVDHYGGDWKAGIDNFCKDLHETGLDGKYLEFSNKVNRQKTVLGAGNGSASDKASGREQS